MKRTLGTMILCSTLDMNSW